MSLEPIITSFQTQHPSRHPFTISVALSGVVQGLFRLSGQAAPGSLTMIAPHAAVTGWAIGLLLGGGTVLFAAFRSGKDRIGALYFEQLGCMALAAGGLGYLIAVILSGHTKSITTLPVLAVTIGFVGGGGFRAFLIARGFRRYRRMAAVPDPEDPHA